MGKRKGNGKRSDRRRTSRPPAIMLNPPAVNATPIVRRRFQFTGSIDDTTNPSLFVTRQCLLSLLYGCGASNANTNFTGAPVYGSVRIRRVICHIATDNTSTSSPIDVFQAPYFEWISDVGPLQKRTRVSMTASVPTHFTTVPPSNSRAGMWSRASASSSTLSEIIFALRGDFTNLGNTRTYRVVLTLDMDCVTTDFDGASLLLQTTAVSTAGIYAAPLDNVTTSSTKGTGFFIPIGLQMMNPWATQTTFTRTN
jgi:hypothetical protein